MESEKMYCVANKRMQLDLDFIEAAEIYDQLSNFPEFRKRINSKNKKHYLGDVKWVLYQYICDLGNHDAYTIRCGKYAYNKMLNMQTTGASSSLSNGAYVILEVNGEKFYLIKNEKLDKKQVVISAGELESTRNEEIDSTIYPDDIVLYFA